MTISSQDETGENGLRSVHTDTATGSNEISSGSIEPCKENGSKKLM